MKTMVQPSTLFLLSWTLTQNNVEAVTDDKTILDLAKEANQRLPEIPQMCWENKAYPNIVYIDRFENTTPLDVSLAITYSRLNDTKHSLTRSMEFKTLNLKNESGSDGTAKVSHLAAVEMHIHKTEQLVPKEKSKELPPSQSPQEEKKSGPMESSVSKDEQPKDESLQPKKKPGKRKDPPTGTDKGGAKKVKGGGRKKRKKAFGGRKKKKT